VHQQHINHRRLVQHQQVAVERVLHIPLEAAALGIDFEQAVDGFGLSPCCIVQALGRAPGRSAEQKLHGLRCENTQDRVDDGGLADARSTGDHEDLGSECKTDSRFLAWRQFEADPMLYPGQCLIGVDRVPG
jgi:hypothetical protein